MEESLRAELFATAEYANVTSRLKKRQQRQ